MPIASTIAWLLAASSLALAARAEVISVDFNTYALGQSMAEMKGQDATFGVGDVWNNLVVPRDNGGAIRCERLVDATGTPTAVSLSIRGPKLASWWSTEKLLPASKVYRDYLGVPQPAEISIAGLRPETDYSVAVLGYPLSWGNVRLTLNDRQLTVFSGVEWKERRQPAGVLTVQSDEQGRLTGTIKGMVSGLHLAAQPLALTEAEVTLITGEPETEKRPVFPPDRQLVYKTIAGVDLHLDCYLPAGWQAADKRPAIVFFHGGSWSGGWKTQFAPQCHALAAAGMVAATAEYRVTGRPPASTPADCVRDAKSAIRWVRGNAGRLGVNPDRIVAGGGSAGGHLAAATAYLDGYDEPGEDLTVSCRPAALVLLNPVIDNSPDGYHYGPKPIAETWKSWSPLHNIRPQTAIPTIFFLGKQDHLIPVATGELFIARTRQAGAEGEFHSYPEAKHGFFNGGDHLQDTLKRMKQFLGRHDLLPSGNADKPK